MRAGTLRARFEIQTATVGKDAAGGPTHTWATTCYRRGAMKPMKAVEAIIGGNLETTTGSHEIRFRLPLTLTVKDRLKLGARIFKINSIHDVDARGRELLVYATEDLTA